MKMNDIWRTWSHRLNRDDNEQKNVANNKVLMKQAHELVFNASDTLQLKDFSFLSRQ